MNPSTALATVIVNALVQLDVRQVVLCPGSRSAPLAYALAEAADLAGPAAGRAGPGGVAVVGGSAAAGGAGSERRIRLHVRIDERSAGFLALGLALGSGSPAAVITTSGTAVANLHPAVLEASHAGVPLLVISADRPHELRGTGANQTTDQIKIFGDAVRWFGEIPAPHRQPGAVANWRNVVARAVAAARGNPGGDPGPVQLNVAFADPLVPDPPGLDAPPDWLEPLIGAAGLTRISPASSPQPVLVPTGPRTVVLAGDGAGPEAALLAQSAGWPLLAEPSSGSRIAAAIGPYRLLLDQARLGARIERVVVYGRPTLSRPVSRLLARDDVEVIVVSHRPNWTDAAGRAVLVAPAIRVEPAEHLDRGPNAGGAGGMGGSDDVAGVAGPVGGAGSDDVAGSVGGAGPDRVDGVDGRPGADRADGWLVDWQRAGSAAAAAIDRVLDDEALAGRLAGPLIARELAAVTGAGDVLFIGASNPIRDLDLTAPSFHPAAVVLANRGLAGIDGTLSSASGVALAKSSSGQGRSAGQVRCLVGDLTFLHDVGGLLVGTLEERPNLQIVVLDDAGGGIFALLEHGARAHTGQRQREVFERVFVTPQRADLAALCAGYGLHHQIIDDVESLRKALSHPAPGVGVIQVKVDRTAHRNLADQLATAARAAVDRTAPRAAPNPPPPDQTSPKRA